MHKSFIRAAFITVIAILLVPAASEPPPVIATEETKAELSAAFSQRLDMGEKGILTFDLFTPELDTAFTSPDGTLAVIWLALRDDSGRLLGTEPGLALARRAEETWQVLLPGDEGWEETLAILPTGMLPLEQSPAPEIKEVETSPIIEALTGYYLPYIAGTTRWLEGSISHFQSLPALGYPSCLIETCRYAYDFTDYDHFPLVASREGTVVGSRDSCLDGSETCTNYIVLRDVSGQTYQIYLHLANGTIPDKLTAGTQVLRGQYLGDSDDTGYSTSNHVHFMVTNDLWVGNGGYYWGHSVDIRFADVAINNGIPRNCYETTHFPIYDGATQCPGTSTNPLDPANGQYTSGNIGAFPPTGNLTRPVAGATVAGGTNPMIDVTAEAIDDVQVTGVRLLVKINGQWVEVGPKVTQSASPGVYDWDVNLCSAGPLNGPTEVAVRVWDHEGNVTSALNPRMIQVDHACPPPSSQLKPAENFDSTAARLSWDAASAGVALESFEIQWRSDSGAWNAANVLVVPGSQRLTWFAGQPGGSYAFRMRAKDINGQAEGWPANDAAETTITLPSSCTPDSFEPDDNKDQAELLPLSTWAIRSICGAGNSDWFKVDLVTPDNYYGFVLSQAGGAAVRVAVLAADGTTLLRTGEAAGLGLGTGVSFKNFGPGTYYLKIDPQVPQLFGTNAIYQVMVASVKEIYLPLLVR